MRLPLIPFSCVFLVACGHVTPVRPVPKDTVQVEMAVGGPLVRLGKLNLPVPLSTAGVRYGLGERYDVAAHAHLTSLSFGVAGLDVGSTYLALQQRGLLPALAVGGRLYGFGNLRDSPRAYLEATGSASTLLGERFCTYVSASGMLQLAGGAPLWSLAVGEQIKLGRFGLQGEVRWYEPHVATRYQAVEWLALEGRGAWGVTLGVSFQPGG
jgi:hypothetical protein